MSRTRTYEFYGVRTSMTDFSLPFAYTGSEQSCREWMFKQAIHVDQSGVNLYLVRMTLVQAIKTDKEVALPA